ncbi:hypothetical protein [Nocardia sp. NRRL S-836]|uniref:hypothetical protein n=1 Tax=Nocardia sp. NRRL S-836 TaxID=1519492 RepID=UPI0006AFC9E5|nr:hypothetical protein [Nocardia sp. NRRL S-836]KOV83712.1 hypothetical protein ADL03_19595 [Nocardia sp. NRRL S-836]
MIEVVARRAAGVALIVLAALVPIVTAAWLSAWENDLAGRRSVEPLGVADIAVAGTLLWGIVLAGLWWHRRRMTMWPVWSRWASVTGLFAALSESLRLTTVHAKPLALLLWAGLVVVCWALGEVVRLVTTRPVTAGLMASGLEIPFPTRELRARLCVRADRLVLDSLASRRKRSRDVVAVPWTALRSIALVEVEQETVCQVLVFSNRLDARAREFDVRPGPALHVVGTARELLIPVSAEVGRTVLTAVKVRSAGAESHETLTEDDWSRATGVRRGSRPKESHPTDKRPYVLGVVGTFLLMPLVMLCGTALSRLTGSRRMQEQFKVFDGRVDPVWIATLGVGSVVFLYLLNRYVIRAFLEFMAFQNYIEAFPEPPPPPPRTGTVPGSGKKGKKR